MSNRVEVKTRTTKTLRDRFARLARANGRSVTVELERLMKEAVERAKREEGSVTGNVAIVLAVATIVLVALIVAKWLGALVFLFVGWRLLKRQRRILLREDRQRFGP